VKRDYSMPAASRRSFYRVVGMGLLVLGGVAALALSGLEPKPTSGPPVTVYLGIHDDLGLRLAGVVAGAAVATAGYRLWRANGGEHRTTE
jgi:hypothetical protein